MLWLVHCALWINLQLNNIGWIIACIGAVMGGYNNTIHWERVQSYQARPTTHEPSQEKLSVTYHVIVVEVVAVEVEGVENGLDSNEWEEHGEDGDNHQATVAHNVPSVMVLLSRQMFSLYWTDQWCILLLQPKHASVDCKASALIT